MYEELPLVSLIIASYNRPDSLGIAIESALAQDYMNLEIIISDDCSELETIQVIEKYLHDSRVKFSINEKNLGLYENFKIAIEEKAKGEYFTMVNNDDKILNPKFISQCVEFLKQDKEIVLVKGASIHHNGLSGKHHDYKRYHDVEDGLRFFENYNYEYEFGFDGIFLNRMLFCKFNFFNFKFIGLDFFINFIMAMQGKIAFIKKPCYLFNVHDANSSSKAYTKEQIEFYFKEISQVMNHYQAIASPNKELYLEIIEKHHFQYIASCLEHFYIHDRKNVKQIATLLAEKNTVVVKRYFRSLRWFKCKIVFLVPQLGKSMVTLKWKYAP